MRGTRDTNGQPEDAGAHSGPLLDPFDLEGADPELLTSGRIADPLPQHTPLFRWLSRMLIAAEKRLRARGGTALRFGIRVLWGLVAAAGLLLMFGPVINAPLDFDDVIDSAELSEVDWIATDVIIDYEITRDERGSFVMRASERFTARFMNAPENTVQRAFMREYLGSDTGFALESVTVDGTDADVHVRRGAATTTVNIEPADGSVFDGTHEIALEYEVRDLARQSTDPATGTELERWLWPVLGQSWPQATKGLDVTFTIPSDVDDALVRAPNASVAWLLVSGNAWLDAEPASDGRVAYSFSNDDTLPPYPDVWLDTRFEGGTFTQPETTPLFWLQTWGPIIPLALLAITTLFALVARRVVWADSVGEPWYTAQSDPPEGVSPMVAAEVLRKPRHAELIAALTDRSQRGDEWLARVGRAAMRAGRPGNLPTALTYRVKWLTSNRAVEQAFRWVPDSYLRDSFILGSIAITVLQWGLLRQLSHQVILSIVWWPTLFVAVSTLLALVTIWAVARPRPLTPKGALLEQHLKGIHTWARATRFFERGPADDALLPYAILREGARSAGRDVAELARVESRDEHIAREWRTEHFLSLPSLIAVGTATALFAGSIVVAATQPQPYAPTEFLTWPSSDVPGTIWTQTEGFTIDAEVTGSDTGGAVLDVTEHNMVRFTPGGSSVPQFTREWQSERFGRSLGLEINRVTLDGDDIPFRVIEGPHTTVMATQLTEVRDGLSEVVVTYRYTDAVTTVADGAQQMRWPALLRFWEDEYYIDRDTLSAGRNPVRPLEVSLTVAPEIATKMTSGGWIDSDYKLDRVRHESGNSYMNWEYETNAYSDDRVGYELIIGDTQRLADGTLHAHLDADEVKSRERPPYDVDEEARSAPFEVNPEVNAWLTSHELDISAELGAVLNFEPGTFANVDPQEFERDRLTQTLPYATLILITLVLLVTALAITIQVARRKLLTSVSVRASTYLALPLAAVAQTVFFWWQIGSMRGSDARGGIAIAIAVLMWGAILAALTAVGVNDAKRTTRPRRASRAQ